MKEGNGTLHKQLVSHLNALPGFNNYAIEMLISVVQNSGFVSDPKAHQCIWASTINWRGDARNKIEIDLLQENRNKSLEKSIKAIGGIKRTVLLTGLAMLQERKIKLVRSLMFKYTAKAISPLTEEQMKALLWQKPSTTVPNRIHESFPDIQPNLLVPLDDTELDKWLERHKKNLLSHAPMGH